MPVSVITPFEDTVIMPPVMPPVPVADAARSAEATSAPFPMKVTFPGLQVNFPGSQNSFSPHVKSIGPLEPLQYTGDPCK